MRFISNRSKATMQTGILVRHAYVIDTQMTTNSVLILNRTKPFWQNSSLSSLRCFFLFEVSEVKSVRASGVGNFYNVIAQDGADPWIYKHSDGWYYFTRTTGGNVRIWRSRSLTSMDAGESRTIWSSPNSGAACRDIWAPEIHFIKSRW